MRHLSAAAPDADLASRIRVTLRGDRALVRIDPGSPEEGLIASDPLTRRVWKPLPAPDGGALLEVPLGRAGELQRILLKRADGKSLWIGAEKPYEEEFAPPAPEGDLFASVARPLPWPELERKLGAPRPPAERRRGLAPWLFALAALLLPLDVGLRRYSA